MEKYSLNADMLAWQCLCAPILEAVGSPSHGASYKPILRDSNKVSGSMLIGRDSTDKSLVIESGQGFNKKYWKWNSSYEMWEKLERKPQSLEGEASNRFLEIYFSERDDNQLIFLSKKNDIWTKYVFQDDTDLDGTENEEKSPAGSSAGLGQPAFSSPLGSSSNHSQSFSSVPNAQASQQVVVDSGFPGNNQQPTFSGNGGRNRERSFAERFWRVVDGKNSNEPNDLALDEKILGRMWQHRTATLLPLITLGLLLDKKIRADKSLLSGGGRLWDKMIGKLPEKVRAVGRSIVKYLPKSTGTKAFVGSMGALGLLLTVLGINRKDQSEYMGGYFFGQGVPNVLMGLYNPALSVGAVASGILGNELRKPLKK